MTGPRICFRGPACKTAPAPGKWQSGTGFRAGPSGLLFPVFRAPVFVSRVLYLPWVLSSGSFSPGPFSGFFLQVLFSGFCIPGSLGRVLEFRAFWAGSGFGFPLRGLLLPVVNFWFRASYPRPDFCAQFSAPELSFCVLSDTCAANFFFRVPCNYSPPGASNG